MSGWIATTVGACLDRAATLSPATVPARDYKRSGLFPIVDQGIGPIAGWTDDESVVISPKRPVIVFGDHTRAIKLVDFPFARGADGTQLLVARDDLDPRFLYYACRAIDLPSCGYNRHFTLLREQQIRVPAQRDEQRQVADVLHATERLARRQKRILGAVEALKRSVVATVLPAGLTDEEAVATQAGVVPRSWTVEQLSVHHTVNTGGTPSRRNAAYWDGGDVPWVKTAEVSYTTIVGTEEQVTAQAVADSTTRVYPPGTVLLAMYGQGVTRGKVAKLGIDAACNQACAAIQSDGTVDTDYLYFFLESQYESIRGRAHGGQQQNLNLDIVRAIPIAYPTDISAQREIAALLTAIDRKARLHQRKGKVLEELFDSLLHMLMTGELDVSQLDLSALTTYAHTPEEAVA